MNSPALNDDTAPEIGSEPPAPPKPVTAEALAAFLAARMCHDYISPAGAIVSGLDLLEDPSAQDMRDEALNLFAASAKKLVALLQFDRIAFGSSAAAESFNVDTLEALTRDVFAPAGLPKPAARTLLNMAQIAGAALPTGGVATLTVTVDEAGETLIVAESVGARARLRPEVVSGLKGEPMADGLSGHWVQAYYLHGILASVGGTLDSEIELEKVVVRARLPG